MYCNIYKSFLVFTRETPLIFQKILGFGQALSPSIMLKSLSTVCVLFEAIRS